MKKTIIVIALISVVTAVAFAGGNPKFIAFPEGYKKTDMQYTTVNRMNGKQVGILFANKPAMAIN